MRTYLIICGGTGGHLTPGIALAEGLRAKGHRCILVISQKKVDAKIIKKYKHLSYEEAPGIYFSWRPQHFYRFLLQFFKSLAFYTKLIERIKPDYILGLGGFLTVASVLAGWYKKVPCVLHEANRVVGRSIRLVSVLARRVYVPVGVTLRSLPPRSIRYCGCPVRQEIQCIPRHIARYKLNLPIRGTLLVVLGGSQGAKALNLWAKEHFSYLAEHAINVLCITGEGEEQTLYPSPNTGNHYAIFRPFSDNMAAVLSAADLVISRAGAGSLAEIVRCKVPSILVPYPHAADQHQEANAQFLEQQGCSIVVSQADLACLASETLDLLYTPEALQFFRKNLQRLHHTNALEFMTEDLEALACEAYLENLNSSTQRAPTSP